MPALVTLAMLFSGTPASAATPVLAGSPASADPSWESIEVTGTGEVFGEPDELTAEFAAETTAPTVSAALDATVAAATRMRDTLIKAGVSKADLRTSNVDVRTKNDDKGKVIGYTVNQGLTATIRDLPKAGTILSDTITAGGDSARLGGVSFGIEDESTLLNQARKKAFAIAKSKAELYAKQAGRPLGRTLKVSETAPSFGASGEQYRALTADRKSVV